MAKKEKVFRLKLWTPKGMLGFSYLVKPDLGRQFSDNKLKADLFINKAIFKEKGKALEEAVREVGKKAFGNDFNLKGIKWRSPFKDTDKDEKMIYDNQKNCIFIRAKGFGGGNSGEPHAEIKVIGAKKTKDGMFPYLSLDQRNAIKGGDIAALNVTVNPYPESKDAKGNVVALPGVTFGLNMVQLIAVGEGFGQGNSQAMQTAEEYEDESDSPDEVETDESPVDDEEENDSVI